MMLSMIFRWSDDWEYNHQDEEGDLREEFDFYEEEDAIVALQYQERSTNLTKHN